MSTYKQIVCPQHGTSQYVKPGVWKCWCGRYLRAV